MNGYMGKVLFVDLTERTYEARVLDEQVYREYVGGFGLGARILYEYLKPGSDPLGPDNVLGFVCGPFVGTKYHGAGRVSVVAKSPLTGGWLDSSCGGNLGPKVRSTGYDGVFITGASDTPLTLLVTEDEVRFLDARHLWGTDALDTENLLKAEHGNGVGVATIGQAGECLSRISGIVHDQGGVLFEVGTGQQVFNLDGDSDSTEKVSRLRQPTADERPSSSPDRRRSRSPTRLPTKPCSSACRPTSRPGLG